MDRRTGPNQFAPSSQRIEIKKKKNIFFLEGLWGGLLGGVDGWSDEQAQTNLPLQLFRNWWHNNALMYKLCKLCP